MMNVYALVSKPQGRKDDENNYAIRMTNDGMMTATFFCSGGVRQGWYSRIHQLFWLSDVGFDGTNF